MLVVRRSLNSLCGPCGSFYSCMGAYTCKVLDRMEWMPIMANKIIIIIRVPIMLIKFVLCSGIQHSRLGRESNVAGTTQHLALHCSLDLPIAL